MGRSLTRREDRRLLTGRGQFIADLELPRMLHAVFVQESARPCAHQGDRSVARRRGARRRLCAERPRTRPARCRRCRTRSWRCRANGRRRCSTSSSTRSSRCWLTTRSGMSARPWPSSLRRTAMRRRMQRELVELDLDPLPAVLDPEAALGAGSSDRARQVRHQPDRRLHRRQGRCRRRAGAARRTGCSAASIITAMPPCRWNAAAWSACTTARTESVTIWSSTQVVHGVRREAAGDPAIAGVAHALRGARCRRRLRRQGTRLSRGPR